MSKYIKWNTVMCLFAIAQGLGIWLLYLAYFSNSNSIFRNNPKENPYFEQMRFKDEQQKQLYKKQWFPTQSEQVILNMPDGFVLDWARNREKQEELKAKQEKYPNSYYKDVPFPEPINRLLTEPQNTLLIEARGDGPTMSASRVKSLVKGNLPLHIEIINNFRGIKMPDDNIIYQEKVNNPKQDKKILMYGYYFWDQIVGQHFDQKRKILTDYTRLAQAEKDDINLVEHVLEEQKVDDWSTLVLHYESIDIACHTVRSYGERTYPTVKLHNNLLQKITNGSKTLNQTLIFVNDHGQNDQQRGMHGGFTEKELTVIIYGFDNRGFIQKSERDIGQVMDREYLLNTPVSYLDVTATYCMLRGIPLPAINIGVIIPDFFINRPDIDNSVIVNNYFVNVNQIFTYVTILKEEFQKPVYSYEELKDDLNSITSKYNELFDIQAAKGSMPDKEVKVYVTQCITFARRIKTVFHTEIIGPNMIQTKVIALFFFIFSAVIYVCCQRINFDVNNFIIIASSEQQVKQEYSDPNKKYIKIGTILALLFLYLFESHISQLLYILLNFIVLGLVFTYVLKVQLRDGTLKQILTPPIVNNSQVYGLIDILLVFSCVTFNSILRLDNQLYERTYDLSQVFFLVFYATWIFMTIFTKQINLKSKFQILALLLILPFATYACGYYSNFDMKKHNQYFIVDEYMEYFKSKEMKFYYPLILTFAVYATLVFYANKGINGSKKIFKRIIFTVLFAIQYYFIFDFYMYQSENLIPGGEEVEPSSYNVPGASYANWIIIEVLKLAFINRDQTSPPSFSWKYATFLMNFSMTSHYVLHFTSLYQIPMLLIIIFTIGHVCMKLKIMTWACKFSFLYLLSQWFFYVSDHLERDEALHVEVFSVGIAFGGLFFPAFNGIRNVFFGQFMTALVIPLFVIAEQHERNKSKNNVIDENPSSFIQIVFDNVNQTQTQNETETEEQNNYLNNQPQNTQSQSEKDYYENLNIRAYMHYGFPLIASFITTCVRNINYPSDSLINQFFMPSFFYQSLFCLALMILTFVNYFLIRFHKVQVKGKVVNYDQMNNEEFEQELAVKTN